MSESQLWQRVLEERERSAILFALWARVVFAASAIVVVMLTAGDALERNLAIALFAAVLVACTVGIRSAPRTGGSGGRALLAAIVDSALLWSLVGVWHVAYTGPSHPVVHLLGHQLTPTTAILIIINAASLRPLYPMLVAGTSATLHLVLAILAVHDPWLASWGGNVAEVLNPTGRGVGDLFLVPVLILATGGIVAWFTVIARRTVRRAAELEQEQVQLREQQLELVLEARVGALAQLVAGVSHEVNSPLGAVKSATDTAQKCIERLRGALHEEDRAAQKQSAQRALDALEQTVKLTGDASQRLATVMTSLAGFVQLDRAEQRPADLADCARRALEANRVLFGGAVRIEADLAEGLGLVGNAAQIAQALSTVLRNAAESIDGKGTVRVRAERLENEGVVTIRDDGRGMSPEQVASLFEIDFERGSRVRARLGMCAARSAVHRHGGTIEVESELGAGTTVRIRLPLG